MKLKKTLSVLCGAGMILALLAGCGNSATNADTAAGSPAVSSSVAGKRSGNSEIIGQVQSIDGNTVTLLLGELPGPGNSRGGGGTHPDGNSSGTADSQPPSGSSDGQQSGDRPAFSDKASGINEARPEMPAGSGSSSSDSDSGKTMSGTRQHMAQSFTAGTETASVTLTDSTAIQIESASGKADGTKDDIAVGSVLIVTEGTDGTASSVVVLNIRQEGDSTSDTGAAASGSSEAAGSESSGSSSGSN